MERDEAIKRIKEALEKRSGRKWSVRGGKGTSWGWIRISAPPTRMIYDWEGKEPVFALKPGAGVMSLEDRVELAKLLNVTSKEGEPAHPQGISIPASSAYRQEYVDRAEGRTPSVIGTPYWD